MYNINVTYITTTAKHAGMLADKGNIKTKYTTMKLFTVIKLFIYVLFRMNHTYGITFLFLLFFGHHRLTA